MVRNRLLSALQSTEEESFSRRRVDGSVSRTPPLARVFENVVQHRGADRRRNQQRLRELVRDRGSQVDVVCSHDAAQFDHRARSAGG